MSATLTPSTPTSPAVTDRSGRSASPARRSPILSAVAVVVGMGGIGLGIALLTGATVVFNILVFTVFTVLWIAVAAAFVFSPGTLDEIWHGVRALPLVIRGVVWLLFLPIMIGLWIWQRTWALPIRFLLVLALGAWNIFVFFPRSL